MVATAGLLLIVIAMPETTPSPKAAPLDVVPVETIAEGVRLR
jgi:hypothetical protein